MDNPAKKQKVPDLGAGGVQASLEGMPLEILREVLLTFGLPGLLRLRTVSKTLKRVVEDLLHRKYMELRPEGFFLGLTELDLSFMQSNIRNHHPVELEELRTMPPSFTAVETLHLAEVPVMPKTSRLKSLTVSFNEQQTLLDAEGAVYDVPHGVTELTVTSATVGRIPTSVEKLSANRSVMDVPPAMDRLASLSIRSMPVPQLALEGRNLVELTLFEAHGLRTLHVPRTLRKLFVSHCDDIEEVTGLDEVSGPMLDCTFFRCKNLRRLSSIRASASVGLCETPALETPLTIADPSATKSMRLVEPGDGALSGYCVLDAVRVELIEAQNIRSLHLGPRTKYFTSWKCHNLERITHETGVMDDFSVRDMPKLTHVGVTRLTSGSRPKLPKATERAMADRE